VLAVAASILIAIGFVLADGILEIAFVALLACTVFVPLFVAVHACKVKVANISKEYDYIILSGQLKLVRVYRRRITIYTANLSSFEALGVVADANFDRYRQHPNVKLVKAVCNWSDESKIHYIYVNDSKGKWLVLWEPSQEMLITIKRSVPKLALGTR
jgi:hypothetical protein